MRTALVLGGAECVYEDVAAALELGEYDGCVGANHIGIAWRGRLDAWVSLHHYYFPPWKVARERRGLPAHSWLVGPEDTPCRFPGQASCGSSGLFALKVALVDLGFDRAVLCGVPLSPMGHFFYDTDWSEAPAYHDGLREALPYIQARARSMSGLTAELLGKPDAEFVVGAAASPLADPQAPPRSLS